MANTPVTSPKVSSIAFDKAAYNAGDTITVTVTYVPGTSSQAGAATSFTFTGTVTDTSTSASSAANGTFVVDSTASTVTDASSVVVSDSGKRTWVKVSDTGTVAKFTATA